MKSILEALADNRLVVDFDGLDQTAEYQDLQAQMDSCITKWSQQTSEDNHHLFDKLRSILDEQNQYLAKETFLYGFRLGAMTLIESFMNKEMLIHSGDKPFYTPDWKVLNKCILKFLAENQINTDNPGRLDTKRLLEIDKERDKIEERLFGENKDCVGQGSNFDNEIYEIDADMTQMRRTSRFIYGYTLGTLLITEIFQGRDTIIAKQNYYDFPEEWE